MLTHSTKKILSLHLFSCLFNIVDHSNNRFHQVIFAKKRKEKHYFVILRSKNCSKKAFCSLIRELSLSFSHTISLFYFALFSCILLFLLQITFALTWLFMFFFVTFLSLSLPLSLPQIWARKIHWKVTTQEKKERKKKSLSKH